MQPLLRHPTAQVLWNKNLSHMINVSARAIHAKQLPCLTELVPWMMKPLPTHNAMSACPAEGLEGIKALGKVGQCDSGDRMTTMMAAHLSCLNSQTWGFSSRYRTCQRSHWQGQLHHIQTLRSRPINCTPRARAVKAFSSTCR
jgi:hypothetical protein